VEKCKSEGGNLMSKGGFTRGMVWPIFFYPKENSTRRRLNSKKTFFSKSWNRMRIGTISFFVRFSVFLIFMKISWAYETYREHFLQRTTILFTFTNTWNKINQGIWWTLN
jgi:hypothetical protein